MNKNVDFSKMPNSEIKLKIMGYENDYEIRKNKIVELVHELEDLDFLYKKANDELNKRGVLNDG